MLKVRVRVPATTANLGAGFDAFGLAFKLYNTFTIEEKFNGKLTIRGVEPKYQTKNNLVYRSMCEVFSRVGYKPKGLYIHTDVNIPVGKGLGSSAACIVGGLVGANAICNAPLSGKELYDIAVSMDGHPDNVAPAMFGGLIAATITDMDNYYFKKQVDPVFTFFGIIPNFPLPTSEARRILPKKIPFKDAVFNISRATMTFLALVEGTPDILSAAMDDKLHQNYRKGLIDHYDDVVTISKNNGALATCISGAGPTILAVVPRSNILFKMRMENYLENHLPGWELLTLEPDNIGVCIDKQD